MARSLLRSVYFVKHEAVLIAQDRKGRELVVPLLAPATFHLAPGGRPRIKAGTLPQAAAGDHTVAFFADA